MTETKHCNRCCVSKPLDNYYKRRTTGKPTAYCKPCQSAQAVERQRSFKRQCVDYKGGQCSKCGYKDYFGALEFHHRDPTKKDFNMSSVKKTSFGDKTKKELDKCDLLCACCHREAHAELRGESLWAPSVRDHKQLHENRVTKAALAVQRSKGALCCDCGQQIAISSIRCVPCNNKVINSRREKIDWPSTVALVAMVESANYSAVGRVLGVTDNAIRKRIKNHPIT